MKTFYVFQGFDGFLYGTLQLWSPQVAGKANAEIRRSGTHGRWVIQGALTDAEKERIGTPQTAAELAADCKFLPVFVLRMAAKGGK